MPEWTIVRDMTISEEDFLRLLPEALGISAVSAPKNQITVKRGLRQLTLRWSCLGERRLGSLALPVLRVELRFLGYAQHEADQALARFDLQYQRGGG